MGSRFPDFQLPRSIVANWPGEPSGPDNVEFVIVNIDDLARNQMAAEERRGESQNAVHTNNFERPAAAVIGRLPFIDRE